MGKRSFSSGTLELLERESFAADVLLMGQKVYGGNVQGAFSS